MAECSVEQKLPISSSDKDDWDEFNEFQQVNDTTACNNVLLDNVLPKNCANLQTLSYDASSSSERTAAQLNDIVKLCFSRSVSNVSSHEDQPSSPVTVRSLEEHLSDKQIWQALINNVYNVLPVDWSATRARQLQQKSLNITALNGDLATSTDLDLSDDEELQQAFDAHSLIVSSVHQEPLFTAEQVIKEIEDMLEDSPSPTVSESGQDESYNLELLRIQEQSQARISATKESIESMKTSSLCELYDEMDGLVRELSEELVQELARRDELEYEKELKNQFISLLLSVQRRHRDFIGNKNRGIASSSSHPSCQYLTTLIPYDPKMVPPSIEHLQIYVKILSAINGDSPTVPALLTDYILKVICPKV